MTVAADASQAVHNSLLGKLSPADFATLTEGAEEVHFAARQQLFEDGDEIRTVYFPLTGLVSLMVVLKTGPIIEALTVAREGFVGTPILNGVSRSRFRAVCQIEGSFLALAAGDFAARVESMPDVERRLRRYCEFEGAVIAQNAACNSIHSIEQRCARWLLLTCDGLGHKEFPLTQEFLSQMLAVRRPGVNVALRALGKRALISHGYGSIAILDVEGLKAVACECYGSIVERRKILLD